VRQRSCRLRETLESLLPFSFGSGTGDLRLGNSAGGFKWARKGFRYLKGEALWGLLDNHSSKKGPLQAGIRERQLRNRRCWSPRATTSMHCGGFDFDQHFRIDEPCDTNHAGGGMDFAK
jgi:hypothetical protein